MGVHELESRVGHLEKAFSAFSDELRLALAYIQPDAGSSLTKSRLVLEKLVIKSYTVEMGKEPRKPMLGEMLSDNQFTRKIERRILSRMNSIRDIGNLGPHGEVVKPNDAARVLDDLCEVLEWFWDRYANVPRAEPEARASMQAEEVKPRPADGEKKPATLPRGAQLALRQVIQNPEALVNERVGPYLIRGLVGAGGSGLVYRAFHTGIGSDCCLKLLYPVEATKKSVLGSIARSVRALHAMDDPHIIRVTDSAEAHFADCTSFYLAMEFIEGLPLDAWSRGLDESGPAFARRLVMAYILATTLARAHTARYIDEVGFEAQGLLHGDLKPANILVRESGAPVLLDFLLVDIQRLLDPDVVPAHLLAGTADSAPITGAFGTPGFMAPEQERDGIVTVKTDIHGLGMTLIHLFLPSIESNKMVELYQGSLPQLDPLRPLLLSMIDPAPRKRPESMRAVANACAEVASALRIELPDDESGSRKSPGILSRLRRFFQ